MSDFGKEIDNGFDAEGYQRKRRCDAVVRCRRCRQDVDLWSETEAWTQVKKNPPRWKHSEYGLSTGDCCGLVYVDTFDGCFVLDLNEKAG